MLEGAGSNNAGAERTGRVPDRYFNDAMSMTKRYLTSPFSIRS